MSDLISRKEAIDALKKIMFTHLFECGEYIGEDTREFSIMNAEKALDVIETLPSVEPKMKKAELKTIGFLTYQCSECGALFHELEYINFCSNCGTKWSD